MKRASRFLTRNPRAVADGAGGIIIAGSDVPGNPQRVFNAISTGEVEKCGEFPGSTAKLEGRCPLGPWSVTVELVDGNLVHGWGEVENFLYQVLTSVLCINPSSWLVWWTLKVFTSGSA